MRQLFAVLVVTIAGAGAAAAEHYDRADLLRMMRSADDKERARARQLLPRERIDGVEEIIAALSDPSEPVWRTASNILCDIANEVSSPGRESERTYIAAALLERLAARPAPDEAARILSLVPLVLPEGMTVAPIAAYFGDPELQMNARDALQLAGTVEARAALRSALTNAEGTFALALIDALGLLGDAATRDAVEARLRDRDSRVRAGAARALAAGGDPRLIDAYQRVIRAAPAELYVETADALLLLADAMLRNGGRFDAAMDLYAWAAKECKDPTTRAAAIASMGRNGDERVVPLVLSLARKEKRGALDHAALEALAVLPGKAASVAIFERHADLLHRFGPSLYAAYGRRGDHVFVPLLMDALESDDAYTRHVASLALLDSNHAAGIAAAAKQAEVLEGEARALFTDSLEMKAIECREHGNAASAGAAYAGLYRLATDDQDRRFALAGMMEFPSEDAFSLVNDLIDENQMAELSVPFLAGIARALFASNRPEDAGRVIDAITPRIASPADLQALLGVVPDGGPEFARTLGFVTQWQVVGPFPWSASEGFAKEHLAPTLIDVTVSPRGEDGEVRQWKPAQAGGAGGVVDLTAVFGMLAGSTAYAYAEIEAPAAAEVVLRMGSDDGIKVWVNGDVVHEHNVDRGLAADQDQAAAKILAGTNKILVQITQGGGGWNMCLRILGADGRPLAFNQ